MKNKKKEFSVSWSAYGTTYVKAKTEKEARDLVVNMPNKKLIEDLSDFEIEGVEVWNEEKEK